MAIIKFRDFINGSREEEKKRRGYFPPGQFMGPVKPVAGPANPRDIFQVGDRVMNRAQIVNEQKQMSARPVKQKESLGQMIKAQFDINDPSGFAGAVGGGVRTMANVVERAGVQSYNVGSGLNKAIFQGDVAGANAELDKNRVVLGKEKRPTLTNSRRPGMREALDVTGQAAELASNFLVPKGAINIATMPAKTTLKSALMELAKTQTLPGAIGGAGMALQEDQGAGATFKDIAISSMIATVIGAGLQGKQLAKLTIQETKNIQNNFIEDMVRKGYPRAQAEQLAREGGFFGLFDSVKISNAKATVARHQSRLEAELSKAKPNMNVVNRTKRAIRQAEIARDQTIRAERQGGFIKNPFVDDVTEAGSKERGFTTSVKNADNIAPEVKQKVSSTYDPITNPKTMLKAEKLVNEDEVAATMRVISGEADADMTATGLALINKFQTAKKFDKAAEIADTLAERLTKAGQTVQAASMLKKLSPEGVLVYAQRQINKANKNRLLPGLTKEKELTEDTAKKLSELAKKAKEAADPRVKDELENEMVGVLRSLTGSGIGKKIATTQTTAQLLNPKTHFRNTIGNEIFFRLERVNKYLATPIDWARSALTGKNRTVTFRTQGQSGYWSGFMQGAKAAWKGEVPPSNLTSQFDFNPTPTFTGKWNPMTYLEKLLKISLQGFDHAAFLRAKNQTIGELAWLKAKNEGLTGKALKETAHNYAMLADENILQTATDYGKYVTFQDDNIISRSLVGVKRGLNVGQDFGAGDIILKYPKTPGALLMRGIEYSPAGFLRSAYLLAEPFLKGTAINTREVQLALSRAITGTVGLTGMGYFLASKGIITGKAQEDYDMRATMEETGQRKYQVNLSALKRYIMSGFSDEEADLREGDNFMSYDWAQPVAISLSMGANANQNVKSGESITSGLAGTIATSIEGGVQSMAEQPVLQGISRLIGNPKGVGGVITDTAKQIPASFVPTFSSQVNQKMDNTQRSTYDPKWYKEAWNRAKAKVPVYSKSLPPKIDVFGNKQERFQNDSNSFVNVFVNPAFMNKYETNPEIRMVMDIYSATGETKQAPRVVPTSQTITVDGKTSTRKITSKEQENLQRVIGEMTHRKFARLATGEQAKEFSKESKEDQAKIIADILSDISQSAKILIIGHRPDPKKGVSQRGHSYIKEIKNDPELSKYLLTIP